MFNTIEVRTDLPLVSPHEYLTYLLEYQKFLDDIEHAFGGYISKIHFMEINKIRYEKTERQLLYILEKMENSSWIRSYKLHGSHRIYALTQKARTCINGRKLTDRRPPSNRQILRSLILSELSLEWMRFDFVQLFEKIHDVFYAGKLIDGSRLIVITDVETRTEKHYRKLLLDIAQYEAFGKTDLRIFICAFSHGNKKMLDDILKKATFIDHDSDDGKIILGSTDHNNIYVHSMFYHLLDFFGGVVPLLSE